MARFALFTLTLGATLVALPGCGGQPGSQAGAPTPVNGYEAFKPVLVSPTGIRLDPLPATPAQEERIRKADAALTASPNDVSLMFEAAQAREAVWRYNESTDLYTRALKLAPNDYRLYLNRAHRVIRLRRFDLAQQDLQRSVALDPYGFNSAYLLALTYYLTGEFGKAADEYGRCMALATDADALALAAAGKVPGDPRSCMSIATDNATKVAITAWRYRALRRAGRDEEAARLLESVPEGLDFSQTASTYAESTIKPDFENRHYYATLLMYRGLKPEAEVLDRKTYGEQWSTVAYAVAVWRLINGDRAGALALFKEITAEPYWARFGHVAAETDLIRLEKTIPEEQ
jgi:tetratricopeptide (TPR) repeat protein